MPLSKSVRRGPRSADARALGWCDTVERSGVGKSARATPKCRQSTIKSFFSTAETPAAVAVQEELVEDIEDSDDNSQTVLETPPRSNAGVDEEESPLRSRLFDNCPPSSGRSSKSVVHGIHSKDLNTVLLLDEEEDPLPTFLETALETQILNSSERRKRAGSAAGLAVTDSRKRRQKRLLFDSDDAASDDDFDLRIAETLCDEDTAPPNSADGDMYTHPHQKGAALTEHVSSSPGWKSREKRPERGNAWDRLMPLQSRGRTLQHPAKSTSMFASTRGDRQRLQLTSSPAGKNGPGRAATQGSSHNIRNASAAEALQSEPPRAGTLGSRSAAETPRQRLRLRRSVDQVQGAACEGEAARSIEEGAAQHPGIEEGATAGERSRMVAVTPDAVVPAAQREMRSTSDRIKSLKQSILEDDDPLIRSILSGRDARVPSTTPVAATPAANPDVDGTRMTEDDIEEALFTPKELKRLNSARQKTASLSVSGKRPTQQRKRSSIIRPPAVPAATNEQAVDDNAPDSDPDMLPISKLFDDDEFPSSDAGERPPSPDPVDPYAFDADLVEVSSSDLDAVDLDDDDDLDDDGDSFLESDSDGDVDGVGTGNGVADVDDAEQKRREQEWLAENGGLMQSYSEMVESGALSFDYQQRMREEHAKRFERRQKRRQNRTAASGSGSSSTTRTTRKSKSRRGGRRRGQFAVVNGKKKWVGSAASRRAYFASKNAERGGSAGRSSRRGGAASRGRRLGTRNSSTEPSSERRVDEFFSGDFVGAGGNRNSWETSGGTFNLGGDDIL